MKYLKVFTDFADKTEMLSDAEMGRLFRAMLKYALSGAEPNLNGNERFMWASARLDIDKQRESYEEICATNKRIANSRSVTKREEASRSVTLSNEASEDKDKEKDKEEIKSKKVLSVTHSIDDRFTDFWSAYPKKVAKVDAERAWKKLKPSEGLASRIINDVDHRKNGSDWIKDNGRYIPYPATYLNQHRWEDEEPNHEVGSIERKILQEWGEEA